MIRFVPRCLVGGEKLPGYERWLSDLLRARGVDNVEKAERFLSPSLSCLHDPYLMPDMEKAVNLIREAIREQQSIVVYGDYDCDGVCASSILTTVLTWLGARVSTRIPDRHSEGYGLNEKAVREMAQEHQLLITVDCGITNVEEVRVARLLGMTVIVTDHHALPPDGLPNADAVLNPLIEGYPFKRLCGAGVAFKLGCALTSVEEMLPLLDLAAIATVADIVPLIDENRVLVHFGLQRINTRPREGIRALLDVAGIKREVDSETIAFQISPRINVGGRLEDAFQCVRLMLTEDRQEAEELAKHLNDQNNVRKKLQEEIITQADEVVRTRTDFYRDKCILVAGEGWNSGIVGLAAGRLLEKYAFPTIVLTKTGEEFVGSCRSVDGVNIIACLQECERRYEGDKLFVRFGGHEAAAGLTIREDKLEAFRELLNTVISERSDDSAYIPRKEYDGRLTLSQVTLEMIDKLNLLQPFGCGNHAPVFYAEADVQQMNAVGSDGSHLKIALGDGEAIRDGIGFGLGYLQREGFSRVEVLFAPARNEFRGEVKPQLVVKAMQSMAGQGRRMTDEQTFPALLQELCILASNENTVMESCDAITETVLKREMDRGRGTLIIAHTAEAARRVSLLSPCDQTDGAVEDLRGYTTVLTGMNISRLRDVWQTIVLADGNLLPGEIALIREKCPRARICCLHPDGRLAETLHSLAMGREQMGLLYKASRSSAARSVQSLAEACGLTSMQVMTGLMVFHQNGFLVLKLQPFSIRPVPQPQTRKLEESALYRYLMTAGQK